MTNKQKVLKHYPQAWCHRYGATLLHWWVFPNASRAFSLGAGKTAKAAWAEAAASLNKTLTP